MTKFCSVIVVVVGIAGSLAALALPASAAGPAVGPLPGVTLSADLGQGGGTLAVPLQIVLMLTVLSIVPALFIMTTCFARIVIVLSFVRHALGTQQMPPNQLLLSLALFLTVFTMGPVWSKVKTEAIDPWQRQEISQEVAIQRASIPVRAFMLKQTREKDLALFVGMLKGDRPKTVDDVPTTAIIPSFMISEMRTAFQMGFVLYLPFLVIDIVVASVLMSMGMMMLPPVLISLPFKVLLFVLVDGWYLIVRSLVVAFQ